MFLTDSSQSILLLVFQLTSKGKIVRSKDRYVLSIWLFRSKCFYILLAQIHCEFHRIWHNFIKLPETSRKSKFW